MRPTGRRPIYEESPVLAIIAAVLFGLALLFKLLSVSVAIFTVEFFLLAGLLCLGLHFAGVGARTERVRGHYTRGHFRRRRT
jgi:hypothetical protein